MLRILCAAAETALKAFRAADNPVDRELVVDLEQMVWNEHAARSSDSIPTDARMLAGLPRTRSADPPEGRLTNRFQWEKTGAAWVGERDASHRCPQTRAIRPAAYSAGPASTGGKTQDLQAERYPRHGPNRLRRGYRAGQEGGNVKGPRGKGLHHTAAALVATNQVSLG